MAVFHMHVVQHQSAAQAHCHMSWPPLQRDELGAPMSCLVAIDALMVDDTLDQYAPDLFLRELNKAFVGFLCPENQGDLQRENLSFLKSKSVVVVSSPSRAPEQSQQGPPPATKLEQEREWNGKDIPLTGITREGFQEFSITVPHIGAPPGVQGTAGTAPSDVITNFSQAVASEIVHSIVHHRSTSADPPTSAASAPVEGAGEGLTSGPAAAMEEGCNERRSSLVQFALDPKAGLESETSMASTLSQVGSDPDPSAISTASRYSSRSSSLTGQPLIIGEYADLLAQTIMSEVEGSLATRAVKEVGVEEGEESDDSKGHSSLAPEAGAYPTPPLPELEELIVHVEPAEPPEFAAQLSQRLIQAAVQRPTPKASPSTPMRTGSYPLLMDRLRGPLSLESGRHSAKWSNAPTMDQDSSPPSPGELDAMAIDYASDISEYANLLVFKCLADTIRSLTGCEMHECFDDGQSQNGGEDGSEELVSEARVHVLLRMCMHV